MTRHLATLLTLLAAAAPLGPAAAQILAAAEQPGADCGL